MEDKIDKAIAIVQQKIHALTVHSDLQAATQAVLNLTIAREMLAGIRATPPDEESEKALTFVIERVRPALGANEMQLVTQAVLNLTRAKAHGTGAAQQEPSTKKPKTT